MIYEFYRGGERVDRVQPKPDGYDWTRIESAIVDREQSGERDGWYRDGEWAAAESARLAAEQKAAAKAGADTYEDMRVGDLAEELDRRDLSKSGNKADLVMRLRAHDIELATESTEE